MTARELAAQRGKTPPRTQDTALRRKRLEYGLTLLEVATAVGLSKGGLSHIEVGDCEPRVGVAIRLARFYEITVEELFGEVSTSPNTHTHDWFRDYRTNDPNEDTWTCVVCRLTVDVDPHAALHDT